MQCCALDAAEAQAQALRPANHSRHVPEAAGSRTSKCVGVRSFEERWHAKAVLSDVDVYPDCREQNTQAPRALHALTDSATECSNGPGGERV